MQEFCTERRNIIGIDRATLLADNIDPSDQQT